LRTGDAEPDGGGSFIEGLDIEDDGSGAGGAPAGGGPAGEAAAIDAAAAAAGLFDRETFFAAFVQGQTIAGTFLGLQTLIQAPKSDGARPAADAIYDSLVETPALHFLLKPGNKWIGRAVVIGAYAGPVVIGCKAELAAKRAAARDAGKPKADRPGPGHNGGPPLDDEAPSTVRPADGDMAAYDSGIKVSQP
jgi:hypothetical protein